MILALTFIGPYGSAYIQNPHLKAKLAEMLYWGTLKHPRYNYTLFGGILNSHSFALEWTFPSVMSFYIGMCKLLNKQLIEGRGGTHRITFAILRQIHYSISPIASHDECMGQPHPPQKAPPRIKVTTQHTPFNNRGSNLCRTNVSRFVQFVNLLLNDVTYLLDEGLSKLIEINKLQRELENPALIPPPQAGEQAPDPREREAFLATTERQAASYISLANETVSLLDKFTAFVPAAFVYPEVVDRLARMLNFNQVVLTGDKCKNLKVKDPTKYRFSPKNLLSILVDIYLNLRGQRAFIEACAADGRSYRREVFDKTSGILRKYSLKGKDEIDKFDKLARDIEEARMEAEEGDEAMGDIPEEFLGKNTHPTTFLRGPFWIFN